MTPELLRRDVAVPKLELAGIQKPRKNEHQNPATPDITIDLTPLVAYPHSHVTEN